MGHQHSYALRENHAVAQMRHFLGQAKERDNVFAQQCRQEFLPVLVLRDVLRQGTPQGESLGFIAAIAAG
jgi:hypothetical protein